MASKFCESCGTVIPDGVKFCPNCGKAADASAAPASAPAPQPQPQQYAAPNYQYAPQPQPNYYQQAPAADTAPLRVGQYIGMFLIFCIPLVNIIMLFVWAFSSGTNLNKKNFARAYLIIVAVVIVLYLLLGSVILAALAKMGGGYYG